MEPSRRWGTRFRLPLDVGHPSPAPTSSTSRRLHCLFTGWGSGLLRPLFGAQVGGGDLEAIEEEAGAARVDVVGGDADEEFSEGLLDGVEVGGGEEGEGAAAGEAFVRADDGRESWW